MKGFIYKIINTVNQHFYIGSTLNFEKRKKSHLYQLRKNKHHCCHLQSAFNIYGEAAFIFSYKEVHKKNIKALYTLEERYIKYCWKSGLLYNSSKCAGGGDTISTSPKNKEIRERMANIMRERYAKMTEEERLNLSLNKIGTKNGNFHNAWTVEQKEKQSQKLKEYYKHHSHYLLGKTFEEAWGKNVADRVKQQISERSKIKVGEKNPFFGKHHSEKTKEMLRQKNKGKPAPNKKQVHYNGIIYESASACGKALNIPMVTVAYRARKNILGFKYIKDEKDDIDG